MNFMADRLFHAPVDQVRSVSPPGQDLPEADPTAGGVTSIALIPSFNLRIATYVHIEARSLL